MVDSFRTFIAIELPSNIRWLAIQHIARLRRELSDVRASWGREDNLHLTLKFLGDVPVDRIPTLSYAVGRAAQTIAPFEIIVSGCGTFPLRGLPRVLWIGMHASGVPLSHSSDTHHNPNDSSLSQSAIASLPLTSLYSAIEAECAVAGFPSEPRPFHPHLTIARLRSSKSAHRLADLHRDIGFPPQSLTVSEVVVFKSELLKDSSKHTALSRHELDALT